MSFAILDFIVVHVMMKKINARCSHFYMVVEDYFFANVECSSKCSCVLGSVPFGFRKPRTTFPARRPLMEWPLFREFARSSDAPPPFVPPAEMASALRARARQRRTPAGALRSHPRRRLTPKLSPYLAYFAPVLLRRRPFKAQRKREILHSCLSFFVRV